MNVEYLFELCWAFSAWNLGFPKCTILFEICKLSRIDISAKNIYLDTWSSMEVSLTHTELSFTQVCGLIQAAEERLQDIKVPSSWI